MKKVLAIMALVAVIAIANIASAANVVVGGTVNGDTTLTPCDITLAALGMNDSASNSCKVVYYTNKTGGSALTVAGPALTNAGDSYEFDEIAGSDGFVDLACDGTGTCVEEYGYGLSAVNATYVTQATGSTHGQSLDATTCAEGSPTSGSAQCYDLIPVSATALLSSTVPMTDGASFYIELAYSSDGDTNSGTYAQTIVLTAT